jgi:hypothetical protein
MKMSKINYEELREPFSADDIEWRVQSAGVTNGKAWATVLAYITNRAIQSRLDSVVGAPNWKNEYSKAPDDGVLCGISIYDADDDRWVTKYDGAENTKVEAVKGGLSSSMKRAAVQWGIGRYLYDVETIFVSMTADKPKDMKNWHMHYDKDSKTRYYWQSPKLPAWAQPQNDEVQLAELKAEITKLAQGMGTPQKSIDARLKEIVTVSEAAASLAKLKGEI